MDFTRRQQKGDRKGGGGGGNGIGVAMSRSWNDKRNWKPQEVQMSWSFWRSWDTQFGPILKFGTFGFPGTLYEAKHIKTWTFWMLIDTGPVTLASANTFLGAKITRHCTPISPSYPTRRALVCYQCQLGSGRPCLPQIHHSPFGFIMFHMGSMKSPWYSRCFSMNPTSNHHIFGVPRIQWPPGSMWPPGAQSQRPRVHRSSTSWRRRGHGFFRRFFIVACGIESSHENPREKNHGGMESRDGICPWNSPLNLTICRYLIVFV